MYLFLKYVEIMYKQERFCFYCSETGILHSFSELTTFWARIVIRVSTYMHICINIYIYITFHNSQLALTNLPS